MHRFFKYLELFAGTSDSSSEARPGGRRRFDQLREIWEASSSPAYDEPDQERAWKRLDQKLSQIEQGEPGGIRRQLPKTSYIRPSRVSLAAVSVVIILCAVLFGPSLLESSYRSGVESGLLVLLPDSSLVTLGKNTVVTARRSLLGGVHGVTVQGEAYFDMRPQASPFVVSSRAGTIRIVGTAFDVRCEAQNLYVAVTHGVVAVSNPERNGEVLVHAGEFLISIAGAPAHLPRRSFASGEPVWISGRMAVSHALLTDVCEEIGRELGVEVRISNHMLDTVRVTGLIQGKDAAQLLAAITGLTGTAFRIENNCYVVY